jgi:hypothetical protein
MSGQRLWRPGIWAGIAAVLVGACLGTDGTGDVTYNNNAANGVTVSDSNPHIPAVITPGRTYPTDRGITYHIVIQTTCGSTPMFVHGSYTAGQKRGDSTLLVIPEDGKDDHNTINVSDCSTHVADSADLGTVRQTSEAPDLDQTYTTTRTRDGITYTVSWTHTRDPTVAEGLVFKPLGKVE